MRTGLILAIACLLAGQATARIRVGYIVTSAAAANMSDVYNWVAASNANLNQAFHNTGFPQPGSSVSSILAYVRVDPYDESNATYYDHLNRMAGGADGYFDYIHDDIVRFGLDAVLLVTDDGEYCGMAYGIAPPVPSYAVTYWPCDNGQSHSTIAHELGHLLGARHAPNQDPYDTYIDGAYLSYVHGYCDAANGFADIMTGNYASCPWSARRGNFFSNPAVIWNGFPAGEPVRSDIGRLFANYFDRLGNARHILPSIDGGCRDVGIGDFRDVAASGNIHWRADGGTRCIAQAGSRTQLRVPAGASVTLTEFEARPGASLLVSVGGAEPLSKPAVPGGPEAVPPPRPADVLPLLTGRIEGGNLRLAGSLLGSGASVRLEVFDLAGKRLHAATREAAPSRTAGGEAVVVPWTSGGNRAVILRLEVPGQGAWTRRLVALEGAAFALDWETVP